MSDYQPSTTQRIVLFVYGSLKRGHSRAAALAGQGFVGDAWTAPLYRMFDCGSYPGLVRDADGIAVHGELWEVDAACITRLDEIEGTSLNLYQRRRIQLAHPHETLQAQSYFYLQDTSGLRDCGEKWEEE